LQGVVGIVASGAKVQQKPGTQSIGTGFVVDARGYVVTSARVLQGKQQVEISAYDGTTHKAQVIQRDQGLDIALLKVPTLSTSRPLALGDTSLAHVGDEMYVLGYPLDTTSSWKPILTAGTVRSLRSPGGKAWVQTDAMVDKGSTGGPMVLASTGEVIGVITFKTGGTETKVTAQPINDVRGWLVKNIR
jgi:serine protease Do